MKNLAPPETIQLCGSIVQGNRSRGRYGLALLIHNINRRSVLLLPFRRWRTQEARNSTSGVSSSLGTKSPSSLCFSLFLSFLPYFVPHRAQWSVQLYNSDNTNTVIRNNLTKILIAALKKFLLNYHSHQYSIINVQKSDYLFNKNREILAF